MTKPTSTIRVRFAPSPTGHLHIGNFRAALFNWLYARHNNGKFLLRIEDTDRARFKKEYVDAIIEALDWCGLDVDEQPVIQSERIEFHTAAIMQLLDNGHAYRCYCTQEEIDERVKKKEGYSDLFSMYDGHCKNQQPPENEKKPFVVRFAVPRDKKEIAFDDMIRGPITFPTEQFDDFIIARSDGTPIYNLVVVVDDQFMNITHVIRGEDHITNTPKQIMLYQALGANAPQFGHLPLILGPSGEKLSKRDAVTTVLDYKKNGYLAQALFNYLVRLGWSHGDQEIFTKQEMIDLFSIDKVGKKGAIFDPDKLAWLNGVYIRALAGEKIIDQLIANVDQTFEKKVSRWTRDDLNRLADLYKERIKTLKELADVLTVVHNGPSTFDQKAVKKWCKQDTPAHLDGLLAVLGDLEPFVEQNLADSIKAICTEAEIKLVALAQPIRIALTGTSASPGIFALLELVGKQETISRLKTLRQHLSQ